MATEIAKPAVVNDEMLDYLDTLRDTGVTNMFGAGPYVENAFDLDRKTAKTVLVYWMESFDERHPR